MRILLVEDDNNLNHNLTYFLQNEGYIVDSCFDGEEALYYCEELAPDLIILDRMLPRLRNGGFEKTAQSGEYNTCIISYGNGYSGRPCRWAGFGR